MPLIAGLAVTAADIAAAEDVLRSILATIESESIVLWEGGSQVVNPLPATVDTTITTWVETTSAGSRAAALSGASIRAGGMVVGSLMLEALAVAGIAQLADFGLDELYEGLNSSGKRDRIKLECAIGEWKGGGGVISCRKLWPHLIEWESRHYRRFKAIGRAAIGRKELHTAWLEMWDSWCAKAAAHVRKSVFASADTAPRHRRRKYSRRN